MKSTLFTLFLIVSSTILSQRNQFGLFLNSDIPNKSSMPNMNTSIGIGLSYGIRPIRNFPLYLEISSTSSKYAYKTLEQTYEFTNGDKTNVDIRYNSGVNNTLIGLKFSTGNDYSSIRFYGKSIFGNTTFKSKIRIADPEDEDDCRPLEKKTVHRFSNLVYGGEIGIEVSLKKFIPIFEENEQSRIFVSVNYLRSKNQFEYINISHMKNESIENHQHQLGERDINAEFINVNTNNVHQHKIAEVYKSELNLISFRTGLIFNF